MIKRYDVQCDCCRRYIDGRFETYATTDYGTFCWDCEKEKEDEVA